jgi:hypothetical protein
VALFKCAVNKRSARIQREEAEVLRMAESRRKGELRKLQEEERTRLAQLLKDVDAWHQSQKIRAYAAARIEKRAQVHVRTEIPNLQRFPSSASEIPFSLLFPRMVTCRHKVLILRAAAAFAALSKETRAAEVFRSRSKSQADLIV